VRKISEKDYFSLISRYIARDQRPKYFIAYLREKLAREIISHYLTRDQRENYFVANL